MSRVPVPYNRQHIFGPDSSNDPGHPVQGYNLDAEYNAVEIALDETQARLAEIQRDDGQLANDSVGSDQLRDDAYTELEDAAADAAQEVIDAGIIQISGIADQAQVAASHAEASAAAAAACRDESCACAAASEDSAEDSADSAQDALEQAADAANSASLAQFYYDMLDDAVAAIAPQTIVFVTAASTATYPLPVPISDEEFVDVHVDGLLLEPGLYIATGSTINFAPPIAIGKTVVIKIAGTSQIMPIVVDDWGFITDSILSSEDWGSVA
jgi:hypothetical protein